ncbi:MAG: DUF3024 domain-containing protein [Myxococcota bacterium]
MENARIDRLLDHFCRTRVPPHVATSHYVFRVYDDTVEILELRPDPAGKRYATEVPAVKLRCSGPERSWRLEWMRDDLAWHPYRAARPLLRLDDALDEIAADPFGCFFGDAPSSPG